MRLRLIGYWEGPDASGWPRANDFVDSRQDPETARRICAYLEDGAVAKAYLGLSECRLCGEHVGSLEKTDGVFIWPEGLSHYVGEHSVRLPDEFTTHALSEQTALEEAEVDVDWWRSQAPTGHSAA